MNINVGALLIAVVDTKFEGLYISAVAPKCVQLSLPSKEIDVLVDDKEYIVLDASSTIGTYNNVQEVLDALETLV